MQQPVLPMTLNADEYPANLQEVSLPERHELVVDFDGKLFDLIGILTVPEQGGDECF
jgi:hypothetical protein